MKNNTKRLAIVSYNGTNFHGSQIQPTKRTVQGEFGKALQKIGIYSPITLTSRTDQGVHAYQQGIAFNGPINFPNQNLKFALNKHLPNDLKVQVIKNVDENFNPRKRAAWKMYEYKVIINQNPSPIDSHLYYYCPKITKFNWQLFNQTAKILQGYKSFHNFTAKNEKESVNRTIIEISAIKKEDLIIFKVYGIGFLRYQVRYLIGAILEIQKGNLDLAELIELFNVNLKSNNRYQKAPASGLYLAKVVYE